MFQTGLLILTQPLKLLHPQIPTLLHRVSKLVSDTLYVHLQPVKGGHSITHVLYNSVPVTSELQMIVRDIYQIGFKVCQQLDIRVLLDHVSNCDINVKQYSMKTRDSIVILDDSFISNEFLNDKQQFLDQVSSRFSINRDATIELLKNNEVAEISEENTAVLKTYKNCVLGGTFDRMHVGHKILLSDGCLLAENKLTVGVSDGDMNNSKVLRELMQPLEVRKSSVTNFIRDVKPSLQPDVITIHDAFGPTTTDPDFQCIILSEETKKGGAKINTVRREKGLSSLDEVVITLVADCNHSSNEEEKVSSSSQRKRVLGCLLRPVQVKNIPKVPYRLGLTGGIASGKSSVCKRLEDLGAGVIDCDKLGHRVYTPGTEAFAKIVKEFGENIVNSAGEIDRKKLGPIVFGDKERLKALNNITWPEIIKLAEAEIERLKNAGKKVVILDAAILLEAGWDKNVHEVWTTFVPRDEAVKRIICRNGLCEDEAKKRFDSQITNDVRIGSANVTLCTLWEYDVTQKQCEKAWRLLQERIDQQCRL